MVSPEHNEQNLLAIWIDEISDSVRGRWRLNFHGSIGDGYGRFSGARDGSSMTLYLRDEAGTSPGWCTGTLELSLEEGDTLGPGTYRSNTCPFDYPMRFVEGEWLSWPFP